MISDRSMWASVAIVDYLRNGVPLEDAPRNHVARSLAALMNCFRQPLDEYWERQMELTDGGNLMLPVVNAGLCEWGVPSALVSNHEAITGALRERSWESFRMLPDPVWKLLRTATGMTRDEWDALPDYCRSLLAERVLCPDCDHSATMESFGEPDPIDDPTYLYQQRMSLVFRCSKCGAEAHFDIPTGASPQPRSLMLPKRVAGWFVLGLFAVSLAVLFWMVITRPSF